MKNLIFTISILISSFCLNVSSQTAPVQGIPDVYKKGSISEQLDQLNSKTRTYENFRAIREDIYQLVSRNIRDTLASTNIKITTLNSVISNLQSRIDSINKSAATTQSYLADMTKKQNSISVLGLPINKTVYNTVMWSLLALAVVLLLVGYYIFKKNNDKTIKARTELASLQKEYDDYKQKKRIEIETMTMNHFNEMKKMKEANKRPI